MTTDLTGVAEENRPSVLSFHATYGCRDRGACCTSGWPIPIEADALTGAERAMETGRLRTATGENAAPFVRPANAPTETPALVAIAGGACVFYRRTGVARCEIHRTLGHAALPLACRQFPRVSIVDPRGVSVTLSHYCPTAAEMLDDDGGPTVIVSAPPAFPPGAEYVGLDVRTALPPALRPDMLMDWDAWWQWEREAVVLIGEADDSDDALARLSTAVERARDWTPGDGPLTDRVAEAFHAARHDAPRPVRSDRQTLVADVLAAIPQDLRNAAMQTATRASTPATRRARQRFLAAHAFANWTAHLGEGLRSWLRSIEAADALIASGCSVRDADLLLRHLADPHALARVYGGVETIFRSK